MNEKLVLLVYVDASKRGGRMLESWSRTGDDDVLVAVVVDCLFWVLWQHQTLLSLLWLLGIYSW